jgi:peptidoglycan/xylan/chitin deacetylase (PgdA/CDA1 family)
MLWVLALMLAGSSLPAAAGVTPPAPPLTWDTLRNASYPSRFAPTGIVTLTDGIFRANRGPDSGLAVRLADKHAFGDLNGDGTEDAVVIVAEDLGGPNTWYQLVAVSNRQGLPAPMASRDLGDHVAITSLRILAGTVVVTLIGFGSGALPCCPARTSTRTYAVRAGRFVLLRSRDTPGVANLPQVAVRPPAPLVFPPGGTTALIRRTIGANGIDTFVLHGVAGQTLSAVIRSVHHDVLLSSYGLTDHRTLVGIQTEATAWSGTLQATQAYVIKAVTAADTPVAYTLRVTLLGPAPRAAPARPPDAPQHPAEKVVYLSFDDGPNPQWTRQVLALLFHHHAHATFFVIGENVVQYPELVRAEAAFGDAVGNHTWDHQSLDGIGRQRFFDEILRTKSAIQAALGSHGHPAPCMRPPYGATDAFTYAYAAELGLSVVLWTVDPQDWSRPGASVIVSRVLTNVYPGAIVLMHDGGGDRSQTVAALGSILDSLSSQGYRFLSPC